MNTPSREKILITVKTYPLLSSKYTETVCTAGLREDGSWIRLYPIAYRYMEKEQRFRKYQWIEADIVRDTRDPRPESYKLAGNLKPLDCLGTKKSWEERKVLVLNDVHTDLALLIKKARDVNNFISLATFKPARIISFTMEKDTSAIEVRRKRKALEKQLTKEQARRLAERVPYRFYYTFIDGAGKRSRLQILDWEIYQLCRKLIRKYGRKKGVIYQHLREKYFNEFTNERDIHLFLGTNKYWHIRRSSNPFMIVGVFYPPKEP